MKFFSCTLLFLFASFNLFSQAFLGIPIEGKVGKDYTIVNYVDWKVSGYMDAYCGTKSYEGHEGTDFVIRNFRQMDSGVNVLAAADGEIIYIHDGEFDRETSGDTSLHLGNYIGIKHSNLYFTYYGHLKKNSIKYKVGDKVTIGQKIAEVGSSGNSIDPHLHFEVYYDSAVLIDPFSGACGNPSSLWINTPAYDTSLIIWENGLHNGVVEVNNIRERSYKDDCCPYTFKTNNGKPISFWSQLSGIKKDKILRVNWYTPSDSLYFFYDVKLDRDYWYYYYYTYIDNKDLQNGKWKVTLEYNGKIIVKQVFEISDETSIATQQIPSSCDKWNKESYHVWQKLISKNRIRILTIEGKYINPDCLKNGLNGLNDLSKGIYIIQIDNFDGETCTLKKVVY